MVGPCHWRPLRPGGLTNPMGDPHISGQAQGSTATDLGRLAPVILRATQSTVGYWSATLTPSARSARQWPSSGSPATDLGPPGGHRGHGATPPAAQMMSRPPPLAPLTTPTLELASGRRIHASPPRGPDQIWGKAGARSSAGGVSSPRCTASPGSDNLPLAHHVSRSTFELHRGAGSRRLAGRRICGESREERRREKMGFKMI
jgi:hypothetical protein